MLKWEDSGLEELHGSSVESGRLEPDGELLCHFMHRNSCSLLFTVDACRIVLKNNTISIKF